MVRYTDNSIIKKALKTLPERRRYRYRFNAEARAIYAAMSAAVRAETNEEGHWWYWYPKRKDFKRLCKRLAKKARQPHRRKNRGTLRAKAAGKNNYRPCRR